MLRENNAQQHVAPTELQNFRTRCYKHFVPPGLGGLGLQLCRKEESFGLVTQRGCGGVEALRNLGSLNKSESPGSAVWVKSYCTDTSSTRNDVGSVTSLVARN